MKNYKNIVKARVIMVLLYRVWGYHWIYMNINVTNVKICWLIKVKDKRNKLVWLIIRKINRNFNR
jgi:hypothetical protein